MDVFEKTDIGLMRESNQDACVSGTSPAGVAWSVVCDGMGGVHGGDVASAIAVRAMGERYRAFFAAQAKPQAAQIREMMTAAAMQANAAVFEKSRQEPALAGMGTTVVSAVVAEGTAHLTHVGDSRAYLLQEGMATRLTTDHSVVQELVDSGDLTEQQARVHPQKNIITRVLGVEPAVCVDYQTLPVQAGSLLLLCTDGLSNYIETEELPLLAQRYTGQELVEQLVLRAKDAGGSDNITVAVITV